MEPIEIDDGFVKKFEYDFTADTDPKVERLRVLKARAESLNFSANLIGMNVADAESRCEMLKKKIADLEKKVNRNPDKRLRTALVYNVFESLWGEPEEPEELRCKVLDIFNRYLNLDVGLSEIEEMKRLDWIVETKTRPIMVRFTTFGRKNEVVEASWRLKGLMKVRIE